MTDNYGENWKLLTNSNGIPSDHFVRAVAEDPARKGLIYAGTCLLYTSPSPRDPM